MRRVAWLLLSLSLSFAGGGVSTLAAQELGAPIADRAPRFLVPSAGDRAPAPVDARTVPVLRRRISVNLNGVTLEQALTTISREAGLRLMYSKAVVPLESRVRLQANGITVAGALSEVLFDVGVDVLLTANGQAVLMKRARSGAGDVAGRVGVVTGRVTDAKTGEGLAGADVSLDDTRQRTSTDDDGRYRLTGVAAGSYTLSVRRIGYRRATRAVAVADGEEVVVDVGLEAVPTQLDEVVTTVTGEQRLRELGHVVGRINADSLVKEAPVSSVSELLAGRVPGLQVFTHSGQVGGQVALQVRTPNSINLGSEPIVIVDGVRYASEGQSGLLGVEGTSRLNDLDPNDIASIEVVKGPSAATLYGTDAANGVIVITTKRGRPGPARWGMYGRASLREISAGRYPDTWWGWQTVDGVPSPTGNCRLWQVAAGSCVQDSVTVLPNPLNDPRLTIFGNKPSWEYGVNVAGGRQEVRYYFAGGFKQFTGPVQMPAELVEELQALRGIDELPDEQLEPNAERQLTLRGNVGLAAAPNIDLQFNSGYARTSVRMIQTGAYTGFRDNTPAEPYNNQSPADYFSSTSTDRTERFFGSVSGQWRPLAWLQSRGTIGLDLGHSNGYSIRRDQLSNGYSVGDDRTRQLMVTGDVLLSAQARLGRFSFRTAVGAQYTHQESNTLSTAGSGLPPGGESVAQAASKAIFHSYSETATLGSYMEETVGFNDRLFLTGALRADGASNFGRDYNAAVYPKVSASWLLSEEPFLPHLAGVDELRLRYAYGVSGQQPRSYMTLPGYGVRDVVVDGVATSAVQLQSIGNTELRPERVREHEFGVDAAGLSGRIRLGLTWYDRVVTDQIVSRPVALGFGSIFRNLGRLNARGFEADLTVRPIATPHVTWQVTLQHALRRTTIEDLGGIAPAQSAWGGYMEGYPLGARFAEVITGYADANGDGIIDRSEVQLSEDAVYAGESTAPRTQTLGTTLGLFQQRVRLSALVQRQSGYTQINDLACGACRGSVDPSTPLGAQAVAVAPLASFRYANIEPADHTRLQEVTVTVEIPAALRRAMRLRTATLSLSGRNLALWTDFSGPDPASASVNRYRGNSALNIPQSRTWVVRVDLGL